MIYEDLNFLLEKKVYLAPYNDLTIQLSSFIPHFLGFVDNTKVGMNILKPTEIIEYDYIVIRSKFWYEIANQFDTNKIIIVNTIDTEYQFLAYNKYIHQLFQSINNQNYDILFLAYNKSNVIDACLVIRELFKYNYKCAVIQTHNGDTNNAKLGLLNNQDIDTVDIDILKFINFKAIVCSIDWADRELIENLKSRDIVTIGLVDGIEDFEDSDYSYNRFAYQTVEFVLTCGKNDIKHLIYKKEKCTVVGLPKMYEMWHSQVVNPIETLVMINVNFTYGTFEDKRDMWLSEVIEACNFLKLNYIIAQHHADKGNLSKFNLSQDDIYTTIKKSSIIISRFSTVISEALTLGKPVVYHNPHNEQVKLYKNPKNAFSISYDTKSLISAILYEFNNNQNIRERAVKFLDDQFNITSKEKPAIIAAKRINTIIKERKL